uniref:Uncharacterized protein n=1 Tax=Sphaerodactylus townsendi TaxID=933632 RepID=A0ACB8E4W6_9SAUR
MLGWRLLENLLVVGCEDDSVSIWDIETGILERHETGEAARAVLAGCEDSPLPTADLLLPILEGNTHKQKDAGGSHPSSSCRMGAVPHSSDSHQEKPSPQLSSACHALWPFTILPVKTKWENRNFHILLFDLEILRELLCPSDLQGLKSPNSRSLHSCDAALERAKSTAEKGALLLRRNKTTGALAPLSGPAEEHGFGDGPAAESLEQGGGGLRWQKKAKSSKKTRRHQPPGKASLHVATEAAKLLLACLLPWGADRETDSLSVQHLGLSRLLLPVSFGLVSQESHLSLTLPGWSRTHCPLRNQPGQSVQGLPSRVLDLRNKYLSAAQEPPGKTHGCRKDPEGPPTLLSLLNRICLVKKILSMPLEKSSLQKAESVRAKWRASQSGGTSSAHEEPFDGPFGFPVHDAENISLVKLIFCWRDQSIEVVEAMQAVLLAEVQRSTRSLQSALANGRGLGPAALARASQEDPKGLLPGLAKSHLLLAADSVVKCDSSLSREISPGGEDISEEQKTLEEADNQEQERNALRVPCDQSCHN